MKVIFSLLIAAVALSSLPSCTSSGIDTSNPAVQSALTDAEQIAANELSALLDQHIQSKRVDVTLKDPIVVGATISAEEKIRRKHPEISKAKAHTIAVRGAKKRLRSASSASP